MSQVPLKQPFVFYTKKKGPDFMMNLTITTKDLDKLIDKKKTNTSSKSSTITSTNMIPAPSTNTDKKEYDFIQVPLDQIGDITKTKPYYLANLPQPSTEQKRSTFMLNLELSPEDTIELADKKPISPILSTGPYAFDTLMPATLNLASGSIPKIIRVFFDPAGKMNEATSFSPIKTEQFLAQKEPLITKNYKPNSIIQMLPTESGKLIKNSPRKKSISSQKRPKKTLDKKKEEIYPKNLGKEYLKLKELTKKYAPKNTLQTKTPAHKCSAITGQQIKQNK